MRLHSALYEITEDNVLVEIVADYNHRDDEVMMTATLFRQHDRFKQAMECRQEVVKQPNRIEQWFGITLQDKIQRKQKKMAKRLHRFLDKVQTVSESFWHNRKAI